MNTGKYFLEIVKIMNQENIKMLYKISKYQKIETNVKIDQVQAKKKEMCYI